MQDLRSAQTVIEKERANITDLSAEREPSTQRTTNLARLSELTAQHRQLSLKLKGYEDRDPTVLRLLGEQIDEKMEQAGRWGGNLDCVRAYLESEMGMDAETFAGRFEVASQDYEPITWQNYASFLPAGNVPVSLFTASDLAPARHAADIRCRSWYGRQQTTTMFSCRQDLLVLHHRPAAMWKRRT